MSKYEEVTAAYYSIKEKVKYAFPRWIGSEPTWQIKKGHCGAQSELLVSLLRNLGIKARYVEGRNPKLKPLLVMRLKMMDVHFWVEAKIGNKWLCLDPTPDKGIVNLWGDTSPGMHLGNPEYTARWDELPAWYKDGYNSFLFCPFRLLSNIELMIRRLIWHFTSRSESSTVLVNLSEASRRLEINYVTLWRWIKKGKVIPVRILGLPYLTLDQIVRLKNERTAEPAKTQQSPGQGRR